MQVLTIDFGDLSSGESEFTFDQYIAALEAATTPTHLVVYFNNENDIDDPPIEDQLVQCISNLKRRNMNHPLVSIELHFTEHEYFYDELLMAAKRFGIRHLVLQTVSALPIHMLVDFCRDNSNLKVLEIRDTTFHDDYVHPNDGTRDAVIVALDKLVLIDIDFIGSTAASNFANFVARISASELELATLLLDYDDDGDDDYDDDDMRKRSIVYKMQLPAVEKLTLRSKCRLEHFKAALKTGTSLVVELDVAIDLDEAKASKKKNLLARFIRGAVKLRSLTIHFHSVIRHRRPPVLFFQAVEACATVTTIQTPFNAWENSYCPYQVRFSPREQHLLQRIATRNVELGRFVASPSTYPTDKLLTLMGQFNNCPSGLYMLTRRLPGVFSFDKLRAPILQKKRKHDDMDETNPNIIVEVAQLLFQVTSKLDRLLNAPPRQHQKL